MGISRSITWGSRSVRDHPIFATPSAIHFLSTRLQELLSHYQRWGNISPPFAWGGCLGFGRSRFKAREKISGRSCLGSSKSPRAMLLCLSRLLPVGIWAAFSRPWPTLARFRCSASWTGFSSGWAAAPTPVCLLMIWLRILLWLRLLKCCYCSMARRPWAMPWPKAPWRRATRCDR